MLKTITCVQLFSHIQTLESKYFEKFVRKISITVLLLGGAQECDRFVYKSFVWKLHKILMGNR